MSNFVPSEYDKAWLKRTLELVVNGGIWGTSWAIYKKVDETTLAVVMRNDLICKPEAIEENIERTRNECKAIGIKFIDQCKK